MLGGITDARRVPKGSPSRIPPAVCHRTSLIANWVGLLVDLGRPFGTYGDQPLDPTLKTLG
jgi:hypothetical protein